MYTANIGGTLPCMSVTNDLVCMPHDESGWFGSLSQSTGIMHIKMDTFDIAAGYLFATAPHEHYGRKLIEILSTRQN